MRSDVNVEIRFVDESFRAAFEVTGELLRERVRPEVIVQVRPREETFVARRAVELCHPRLVSSGVRIQARVGFERFVTLLAVELPVSQVRLHVRHQKRLFDELFGAVEALKLSLGGVRSNMFVTLVFVLEENPADVTCELLHVGVLEMVDLQTLIGAEFLAADFARKFSLCVNQRMRL